MIKFCIPAIGVVLVGVGLFQATLPQSAHSQEAAGQAVQKKEATRKPEAKSTEKPAVDPDLDVVRANSEKFVKAFNAGNSKDLAALFSEKAEAVDEDGTLVEGRANIEQRFAGVFKDFPKAQIVVEITALRHLTPDVAVEDGESTVTLDAQTPPSRSVYTVVHVKRDGKWLFASVRDFPPETTETAHDQLKQLEWLVGKWVDESREGRVETDCQWEDNGNYLIQKYVVKTRRGRVLSGTQRIAWDPLRRAIRSWVFDQSGGMVESNWTPINGGWLIKAEGTTAEGDAVSATRLLTPISNDSYQLDSSNQVVGGELLPDSAVRVVRRPPPPAG